MPYLKSGCYYDEVGRECTFCKKYKKWTKFGKHCKGIYGKQAVCKKCMSKKQRMALSNTNTITQEYLKDVLFYNPNTGVFIWKINVAGKIKIGDFAGHINKAGYSSISIDNKRYRSHRLAWLYVYGELPKKDLDHIDLNPLNNKISNLREVTHSQNMINRTLSETNTSKIVGVSFDNINSKWRSYIWIDSKQKQLGRYKSKLDAAKSRRKAELKYGYDEWIYKSTALDYILKHEPNYIDKQ